MNRNEISAIIAYDNGIISSSAYTHENGEKIGRNEAVEGKSNGRTWQSWHQYGKNINTRVSRNMTLARDNAIVLQLARCWPRLPYLALAPCSPAARMLLQRHRLLSTCLHALEERKMKK